MGGGARRREMPQPSQPYVLGDLTIDYPERRVSLAVRAMEMTDIEFRTMAELSVIAGRMVTCEHLLKSFWRLEGDADLRPMRSVIRKLPTSSPCCASATGCTRGEEQGEGTPTTP